MKIFAYQVKSNIRDVIGRAFDEMSVRRIESLSQIFNNDRKGKIAIFAGDHIGIHINQFGYYDKHTLDVMFNFFSPLSNVFFRSIALDVGANIGNHSLFFARRFLCVHSFEPNPRTFSLLKFNSLNEKNIFVYNFGLGDQAGQMCLYENGENLGASSLVYNVAGTNPVSVAIDRLDDVELDGGDIAFIKIDVEGFEYRVLLGGMMTISKHMPIVMFEQHASEFEGGTTKSIEALRRLGYVFCWIESQERLRGTLYRKLKILISSLLKRPVNYYIVANLSVPAGYYGALVAVPKRFQPALGLELKASA